MASRAAAVPDTDDKVHVADAFVGRWLVQA